MLVNISVVADPPPISFLLTPFPSSVPAGLPTVGWQLSRIHWIHSMVMTHQRYQQGLLTLQTIVIDASAGETFQVTLVVNFAGLLDCSAVSNLLTSIFILRSFLMSLQISPAARILWLRWLFPFESIFWMDLICVVSALCSLQRKEEVIWCHFSAKFSRKSKENIGSFSSPLSPPPYIFHFQPKVYSQGFILSVVPVCPFVHQLISFRELVCSITMGYMFPQAKHFAVFLFGKT